MKEIAECNRKLVFVIVFFIIGHNRNRAQDTLGRIGKPVFWNRQSHIFFKNANRERVHLLNGWQTGKGSPRRTFCPQNGRPCPSISQSDGPSTRPCLSMIANRRQGKPLVSRASAGSMWCTSIHFRLVLMDAKPLLALVVDLEAWMCRSPGWEPPTRGTWVQLASNSFQVKGNDRKTIMRMKSKFEVFPFNWSTQGDTGRNERKLTISSYRQERTSDENRRLPSTLAGLTTKTPCSRRIAVNSRLGLTPGNKM